MQQKEEEGTSSSAVSFCPSFNDYASDKLVDIAARVSREFKAEKSNSEPILEEVDDGDDFEFVCIGKDFDASELFFDGQIREVFPVFNRDLLLNDGNYGHSINLENEQTQLTDREHPLEKLFVDDDQAGPPSSSSSDADEPDEVHHAIFCIWSARKNPIESSPSRCKKSNSTGSSSSPSCSSSKKWLKLRNLLKRSNSDGKESLVFLSKLKTNTEKEKKNSKDAKSGKAASAHPAFYIKNKSIKEGDKKRSYLPYRQDLVGLFSSHPHGIRKTFPKV